MGLWIRDSELEVFRITGVDARFYLKRISRAAMLKAQRVASRNAIDLVGSAPSDPREQRKARAEAQAEHEAKPIEQQLDDELHDAYTAHDRKTVLDFGLIRVEEGDADDPVITEGLNWIKDMDGEIAERIFRELVKRNAVLEARLKA